GGAVDLRHTDGGGGWLGRVGGGYDYQIAQRWGVGVLADYDFSSLKGGMTLPGSAGGGEEQLDLGRRRSCRLPAVGKPPGLRFGRLHPGQLSTNKSYYWRGCV